MKTAGERPHPPRAEGGLPERGVSPSSSARTELAIGYQVHFPPHRSQQRTNALCKAKSSRLWQSRSFDRHPPQEPGHNPIPSGHILQGRRINRSVPGRPAVPQAASPIDADVRASVPRGSSAAFKAVGGPARLGRVKGAPVPRLRGVKGAPVPSTVTRTLAAERPPARSPPDPTPLEALHLSVLTLHVVGKAHFYHHVG